MNFDSTSPTVKGVTPSVSFSGTVNGGIVTVQNISTQRITSVQLSLANVLGIAGSLSASVLMGDYGGTRQKMAAGLWSTNGVHCPVTAWEDADKSGVAWVWDDNILPSGMEFWVNPPINGASTTAQALLNFGVSLDPGKSISFTFEQLSGANIVEQMLNAYRARVNATLAANGVSAGSPVKASGMWLSSGWQPDPVAYAASMASYATRLMMWSPPDGQGWYEYLQPRLAWWPQTKMNPAIPIGGLMSPAGSPRIDQTAAHWALDQKFAANRVLPAVISDPDVQAYALAVRNEFVAKGFDLAFWDVGQPYGGTMYDLLQTHQASKAAGLPLLSEAYSPITASIAGVALKYYYGGYTWDRATWTREIHIAICPDVPFVAGLGGDATSIGNFVSGGINAWDDLMDSGVIPMVPDWAFGAFLAKQGPWS